MAYDIVYVNGCSLMRYAAGPCLDHYVAKHFNAKPINKALGGSSCSRIMRTSMRDAIKLKNEKILMLIGLSPLSRHEIFISEFLETDDKFRDEFDGDFYSFQVGTLQKPFKWWTKKIPNSIYKFINSYYENYNEEGAYVNLLVSIIGFTTYCKLNNIDYVIFNSHENKPAVGVDTMAPFIKDFQKEIDADNNILPLDEFTFTQFSLANSIIPFDYDEYGVNGHPPTTGHKLLAEFLIDKFGW